MARSQKGSRATMCHACACVSPLYPAVLIWRFPPGTKSLSRAWVALGRIAVTLPIGRLCHSKSTAKQTLPANPRNESTEKPPKNMHTSKPASKRTVDYVWQHIEGNEHGEQTFKEDIDGLGEGFWHRYLRLREKFERNHTPQI